MEGEHTVIQKRDSTSRYLNYKNTHSIVPLAVAGPDFSVCTQIMYPLRLANSIQFQLNMK